MGTNQSKGLFRVLPYNCHELAHTWDPNCSSTALDLGFGALFECYKIYTAVYAASEVVSGRYPTFRRLKKFASNVTQSSVFLAFNGFGYVVAICAVNRILGGHSYYSLGFGSAYLASLAAIFIERPSRRAPLAVYVNNVALESLLAKYLKDGTLPSVPYGDLVAFSSLSAVLLYLYRRQGCEKGQHSDEGKDIVFSVLRALIGPEERKFRRIDGAQAIKKLNLPFAINAVRTFNIFFGLRKTSVCPHSDRSCLIYAAKGFLRPFATGVAIQAALLAFSFLKRRKFDMGKVMKFDNARLGLFLGSFAGICKVASCLIRVFRGEDSTGITSVPAGFLAGAAIGLYRSPALVVYVFCKTVEILLRNGVKSSLLPAIPFFTELIYAYGTAVLFHLGVTQAHNLKPSYMSFLNRLSNMRFDELNRFIFDYEYGVDATRIIKHMPTYDPNKIGPELKEILPTLYQNTSKII